MNTFASLPPGFELIPDSMPSGPALPPGFELMTDDINPTIPPAANLPPETWGEYAGGLGLKAAQGLTFNYADEIASAIGSLAGYDREELLAVREALAPDPVVSRKLAQVLDDTPVGHDLVAEARNLLSRRYEQVVPRMSATVDQQLGNDVIAIAGRLPGSVRGEFQDAVRRHLDEVTDMATGRIDGRGLQQALGSLRNEGRSLISSQASTVYQRNLGAALLEAREALIAAAGRSTASPRAMTNFRNLERAYAGFARVRDAASRTGADMGTFTPAQLWAAVRAGDKSAGKGATATGTALLQDLAGPAKSVMTRKVADSGTPERVALLGAIASPASIPTAMLSGLPLAALYTKTGRAAFERLAAGSPQTRTLLRQMLEQFTRRAAPVAASAFGS